MSKRFASPLYNVTAGGEKLLIDVTHSISAGLSANGGLMDHIISWMKDTGCTRVLDFGAGALRHSLPLLRKGMEVIAFEYEKAYERPKCAEFRAKAEKHPGFTKLMWPHDFINADIKYDVAILSFVLQVIPVPSDREAVLKAIAKRFDQSGPKRLYYASRFGLESKLGEKPRLNDGWVMGVGSARTFYTEWNAADTDKFFKRVGFHRAGTYKGTTQSYIYELNPGVL